MFCRFLLIGFLIGLILFPAAGPLSAQQTQSAAPGKTVPQTPSADKTAPVSRWISLSTAANGAWEPCNFGGDGEVHFSAERIEMTAGDPLTGVRLKQDHFPREQFEIELQARRTEGFDFFCGLTFPIGKGYASFILGGWSGGVVGLSSIDGQDASENDTTTFKTFENGRWYTVRVRVDQQRIRCWIDDKVFVDQPRGEHEFTVRSEMDPSLPVGIAGFQVTSELRNLRWRRLAAMPESNAGE